VTLNETPATAVARGGGTATVASCTFSGNDAASHGGGINNSGKGGGEGENGTMNITDSTINGNSAGNSSSAGSTGGAFTTPAS
jgi:predicted outer membrane repeat protein